LTGYATTTLLSDSLTNYVTGASLGSTLNSYILKTTNTNVDLTVNSNLWRFGTTGNTTFPTGLTLAAARGPSTVNFLSGVDKVFQIETQTAFTSKLWNFDTNGDLQIPGDIKSNSNINIEINLFDSTRRIWSFGEDGQLTFPDGGNLRVSAVPATSIGSVGDTAGMLAFNASYAYYCTANYDGVTNIWRRTAHDVATW
jgi:hypothetical protein